jgi:hypothetical protein
MSALNLTSAEALQNYTRKFHDKLFDRAFYSFSSLRLANLITGVKGQIVLTDLIIGDLSKRANPSFRPLPNIATYRPRLLTTVPVDTDFVLQPKLLANSFLEGMRKAGQNGKDIPFEGQVLGGFVNKIRGEQQKAFWQAVKKTANTTLDDKLIELFDGGIQLMKTIRAANGYTPIGVQGGTYTAASIGKNMMDMFDSLGAEAKQMGVEAFCSRKNLNLYITYMRGISNGQMPNVMRNKKGVVTAVELENGMGWLMTEEDYGDSNVVFMTQPGNLTWATDELSDSDTFEFKDVIKSTIQATLSYRVGMDVRIAEQNYLAINDLN